MGSPFSSQKPGFQRESTPLGDIEALSQGNWPGGEEIIRRLFLDLVRIDSPPGRELALALKCRHDLEEMGLSCWFDTAGEKTGGETGNLHAFLPGKKEGPPLVLCAHMDTVPEAVSVNVKEEKGCFLTDGKTPLGADDKAGIAIILGALRKLSESRRPLGDIHVLFTVQEEIGLMGSKLADLKGLSGSRAYVLDGGPVDRIIHRGRARTGFTFTFHGKEAHLTREPHQGINAAQIAAQAVASMPLGQIDPWTNAAIASIHSQDGLGKVPGRCLVKGEVSSFDEARMNKALGQLQKCAKAAVQGREVVLGGLCWEARLESEITLHHPPFSLPDSDPLLITATRAAKELGLLLQLFTASGGCDANILSSRAIPSVILGTGMAMCHTKSENIRLSDMVKSAKLLSKILELS